MIKKNKQIIYGILAVVAIFLFMDYTGLMAVYEEEAGYIPIGTLDNAFENVIGCEEIVGDYDRPGRVVGCCGLTNICDLDVCIRFN